MRKPYFENIKPDLYLFQFDFLIYPPYLPKVKLRHFFHHNFHNIIDIKIENNVKVK